MRQREREKKEKEKKKNGSDFFRSSLGEREEMNTEVVKSASFRVPNAPSWSHAEKRKGKRPATAVFLR